MARVKIIRPANAEEAVQLAQEEIPASTSVAALEPPAAEASVTLSEGTEVDDPSVPVKNASTPSTEELETPVVKTNAFVCETAVCVYSDREVEAPWRKTFYLCRTQVPPPEQLQEEWSLEPQGFSGSWGYVFNYDRGELNLYQLEKDENLVPSTQVGLLTYNDWAILKIVVLSKYYTTKGALNRGEEIEILALNIKRARRTLFPTTEEIAERKTLFSALWMSKESLTSRWSFRVSICKYDHKILVNFFILESINSECGVFKTLLVIPIDEWAEKVKKIGDKISALFQSSRSWVDIVAVKKKLSF